LSFVRCRGSSFSIVIGVSKNIIEEKKDGKEEGEKKQSEMRGRELELKRLLRGKFQKYDERSFNFFQGGVWNNRRRKGSMERLRIGGNLREGETGP